MAKDPAATTGPVSDDTTSDNALHLNRKNKYRDVQKVDMRLREAVAAGDENYVRSRLGGDRVLSEAEILLMIKTRQEAEEKVSEQLASAAQAAEQQAELDEAEEESFTQWAQRYVASRIEAQQLLDAQGRDRNGFKFYANFGYDSQGNYNDSFGGQMGNDGIYHHPDGMEVDIRRGVVTQGNATYNVQTDEAIIYDEEDGYYVHMRRGPDGKMVPVEVDGKPHIMNQQEKEQLEAQWRATNRPMSDAEYDAALRRIRELDVQRGEYFNTTRTANGAASAEGGTHEETDNPSSTTSRGRDTGTTADRARTDAPGPSTHIGITLGGAAATGIAGAIEGWRDAKPKYQRESEYVAHSTRRTSEWGSQFQRREQRRRAEAAGDAGDAFVQVDEADRKRLEAMTSRFHSGNTPQFAMGEASRQDTSATKWVKDKDGGVWDDKGGYYDTKGGYWDKQGGYLDASGNYMDQYGGFKSTDGSYTDSKGNYVDPEGNLWLAGNNSNTPDFPKKEGVNYIDVLAKAAENRYGDLAKDNAGMTAEEAKTLQESLTKIEKEYQVTKQKKIGGPIVRTEEEQRALDEASKVSAKTKKSSFINDTPSVSAEAQTPAPLAEKETAPVSLKRNAVPGSNPRSAG